MKNALLSGLTTVLLVHLMLMGSVVSAQTIDQIQSYDATGVPNSPYLGQVVTVSGVMIENYAWSTTSHHIIGSDGSGISLYYGDPGDITAVGDQVSATGTVAAFADGQIYISAPSLSVISSGNALVPETKTIAQAISTYENVGRYLAVTGTVASKSISGVPPLVAADIWIKSGSDSLLIYIDKDTQIDVSTVFVGEVYEFTGPCAVHNSQIELKLVKQEDIVKLAVGTETTPWGEVKALFR